MTVILDLIEPVFIAVQHISRGIYNCPKIERIYELIQGEEISIICRVFSNNGDFFKSYIKLVLIYVGLISAGDSFFTGFYDQFYNETHYDQQGKKPNQ